MIAIIVVRKCAIGIVVHNHTVGILAILFVSIVNLYLKPFNVYVIIRCRGGNL